MDEHEGLIKPATDPEAVGLPLAEGQRTERAAKKIEIADRRRRAAQLLVRRVSQREIARLLGVSQATIASDMKALRSDWKEESQIALEDHIASELAILNADEQMLRTRMDGTASVDHWLRYYDRVMRVMEKRTKLLGLDAPIRLELARAEAKKLAEEFDLDPEELLKMAEDIVMGKDR